VVEDPTRPRTEAPPEPPIADPAPIGLTAFALTTFVLSCVNAGLASESILQTFVPLAFFYGGLTQLLAGLFELRNRNMFGATAFCGYGAFWISLGFLVFFEGRLGLTEETLPIALGLTLLGWTIFTFIMWIGSFGLNVALAVVFTLLLATFALLTIGELGGAASLRHLGGYVGIATAVAAWYTAAAEVINDTYGRKVLPLGERG
jgi:uncharacterized protein